MKAPKRIIRREDEISLFVGKNPVSGMLKRDENVGRLFA